MALVLSTSILAAVLVSYRNKVKIKTKEPVRIEEIPVVTRSWKLKRPAPRLLENMGAGDCLFYCFQQAMSSSGKRVSIKSLRKAVAESMGDDQLETLKAIYQAAVQDNDFDMLADYSWLRGVENLAQLKSRIMTREYYGDDMALPILEKKTGLNATVVKGGEVQKRLEETTKGGGHIVLLLKDLHYRIVAIGKTLVFPRPSEEAIAYAKSK